MRSEGREQKGKELENISWTMKYMRGDREVVSKKAWVWESPGREQDGGKAAAGVPGRAVS